MWRGTRRSLPALANDKGESALFVLLQWWFANPFAVDEPPPIELAEFESRLWEIDRKLGLRREQEAGLQGKSDTWWASY